jgi:predicted outer membrane repeat protein
MHQKPLDIAFAVLAALAPVQSEAFAQEVIFVNAAATGLNDGTSWTDSRTSLQDALGQARSGDAVWVASGNYRPGSSRVAAFQLVEGVAIFGGFAGVENPTGFDLGTRDLEAHPTILDGNIGSPAAADNVFHVVTAIGVSRATVLDGFTITGGDANGVTLNRQDIGAGLLNLDASPTIRHCLFTDNQAGTRGGAIHIDGGSPLLVNCRFFNNRTTVTQAANNVGGAIYANAAAGRTAQAQFINCLFAGNRAGVGNGGSGGALYDDLQSVSTLVNCTLLHNFADTHGGGVFGSPVLTNCIVWGNRDRDGAGRASQIRGSAIIDYSCVQGGWAGAGNIADDPLFRDELGADGVAGTGDDDARLSPGSPCIDAGDNDALPVGITRDLDGGPRFVDDPVTPDTGRPPGSAIVDPGAFEYQASCAVVADCDDGLYCNGVEACVGGRCTPGAAPLCDDYVACTRDSCRESDHACFHEPDDARCDNGVFCDEQESCDVLLACIAGMPVRCDDGVACTVDSCDELARSCTHDADAAACRDDVFCNGEEMCDPVRGCQPGAPPSCDDGVACTFDRCEEDARACVHETDDAQCGDGLFCNGIEACTPTGCAAGAPPCTDPSLCDENADLCLSSPPQCLTDSECGDANLCTDEACTDGACLRKNNTAPCDDGNPCTGDDACVSGACAGTPIAGCGASPPTPTVVTDGDADGMSNADDRCPATKLGAIVDSQGCSCDQLDDDGDGVDNCLDVCPSDKAKNSPGLCGCGMTDRDSDRDGSPDCIDQCPGDAGKAAAGICGCNVSERDSDRDGTPDCLDRCPNDPLKTAPTLCGCNSSDADDDSDGVLDCNDLCLGTELGVVVSVSGCPTEAAPAAELPDSDGDAVTDDADLCPRTPPGEIVDMLGCAAAESETGRGIGTIPNQRRCGLCGATGALGIWFWPAAIPWLFLRLRRRDRTNRDDEHTANREPIAQSNPYRQAACRHAPK